jgi:hypothetical protein
LLGVWVTVEVDVRGITGTVFFALMTGAFFVLEIVERDATDVAPSAGVECLDETCLCHVGEKVHAYEDGVVW